MGKSSIPLIIEEVLYNKNSKGIKKADIPNRYINNGYDIYLAFTKEDILYEIVVNRKASIKVKLLKDGEDISSHTATNTYKTLQEVLGIDFKTFSQLVYQNTNSSLQFLTATDTNRKKFLIDLLHLEEYVVLFEVFKEASRHANSKITEINAAIATIEKWLHDNKLESTTILPMLNLEIDTSQDEEALRSLLLELENISQKNKKINQIHLLVRIVFWASVFGISHDFGSRFSSMLGVFFLHSHGHDIFPFSWKCTPSISANFNIERGEGGLSFTKGFGT